MMSKKQWVALLFVFITYLLLGATIFYHIEKFEEDKRRNKEIAIAEEKLNTLDEIFKCFQNHSQTKEDQIKLTHLIKECHKMNIDAALWTPYNAFFFVVTVVSTIGYGNLAPSTTLSRLLMIFYALIGIPMNGILLASLGEFFSMTLLRVHYRHKHDAKTWMITDILRYLIPGIVVFILLPGVVFMFTEDWSFDKAVYYAFVTLTTIGFGDLVAGQASRDQEGMWWFYRIVLIVWIIFGLGYLVMILGFITRGMRSKKMAQLEHKLAENLKTTQTRLWQGFTKDMGYLRRILNEMYLQKLKPVYRDDDLRPSQIHRTRSSSEPALPTFTDASEVPVDAALWRRRANSETLPRSGGGIVRVLSESDLGRIDKDATFATATVIQPVEFLARFVTALGAGPTSQELIEEEDDEQDDLPDKQQYSMERGGVQGFSDEEILASEKWTGSGWTLGGGEMPSPGGPRVFRGRAASEVRIPMHDDRSLPSNAEWTWSGVAASRRIHELIRARQQSMKAQQSQNQDRTKSPDSNKRSSQPQSFFQFPRFRNPLRSPKKRKKAKSLSDMFFFQRTKRSHSLPEEDLASKTANGLTIQQNNYLTHMPVSGRNNLQSYLTSTAAGRRSRFSSTGDSNADAHSLLEETSLADFFRALSSIHSRVEPPTPRRKLGTASLTPPYTSLTSLVIPPAPLTAQQIRGHRRFSLRPVPVTSSFGSNSPAAFAINRRRNSLKPTLSTSAVPTAFNSALLSQRRSSLRPIPTPALPGTPPSSLTIFNGSFNRHRRLSLRPTLATVPASAINSGNNTPTLARSTRRFSVRPTANPPPIPTRPVGRDLRQELFQRQRQMSESNVLPNRTARRNSLWDVVVDKS